MILTNFCIQNLIIVSMLCYKQGRFCSYLLRTVKKNLYIVQVCKFKAALCNFFSQL